MKYLNDLKQQTSPQFINIDEINSSRSMRRPDTSRRRKRKITNEESARRLRVKDEKPSE